MKQNKTTLQLVLIFFFFQGTSASQKSSVKTSINKATVDTAKETKINNNHKSRNELCFKKKALHNEKRVLLFFLKFSVNN